MGRDKSYHLNIGCHNCMYHLRGMCTYEEKIESFLFDGCEDDIDEGWDKKFEEKVAFRKNNAVDLYGHCDNWKLTP